MNNYIKTDEQLHWLCQVIAKTNRSFVPKIADDSHTNLYFDWLGKRIVGRWIESQGGGMLFALNLANLQFQWLNSKYQIISSFETVGKKLDTVEKEIAENLDRLGLNPNGFTDRMHYEIPNYPFKNEDIKSPSKQSLKEWIYFRNLANKVCTVLLGHLQIEGEIRIWPHHFDTGIYVLTKNEMGIGFGLAMSDAMVGEPYFYMSGYPANGSLDYKDLPLFALGTWEIGKGWKGAILPLSELKKLPKKEYIAVINDYLLKAVNWFANQ